ncbi:MAG: hypothetical protein RBT63_10075 [Bdellovibrionales bacterium]|jgi:hypothetical protein|nr:hypothetical protein [Bdellovibrionales bacterium]
MKQATVRQQEAKASAAVSKGWAKRSMLAVAGSALVASTALAAVFSLQDVNGKVAELTKDFNNNLTALSVEFTALTIDALKTVDLGVTGKLRKVGDHNILDFELTKLAYAYGDGTRPSFEAVGKGEFDFVYAIGQTLINDFAGELDGLAVGMAQDYAAEYGDAVAFSFNTVDLQTNANGDVASMNVAFEVAFDLAKLPEEIEASNVALLGLKGDITVTQKGFEFHVAGVLNPAYSGFEKEQNGMKEYVESLLANDPAIYQELKRSFDFLDSGAKWLVELKADE